MNAQTPLNAQTPRRLFEPRWPVVVTLLGTIFLVFHLSGRVHLLPSWFFYGVAVALLIPTAGAGLSSADPWWLRLERRVMLWFVAGGVLANAANLYCLLQTMVYRSNALNGVQLLMSSVGVWVCNMLLFALLYWQLDRGGPEPRANHEGGHVFWLFPQDAALDHVRPGWAPIFADYLFLSFSTATAFSTTDGLPLRASAKLLMMLESTISLMTIATVASRAINILGG